MLDTIRSQDEAALQRAIDQLEADMIEKVRADMIVANDLRTIKTIRTRIAETTPATEPPQPEPDQTGPVGDGDGGPVLAKAAASTKSNEIQTTR
jgi:hypothetical protein